MGGIVDHLLRAPAWAVYTFVAGLVFLEDAIFVGFVVPGETAAVIGGVAASQGRADVAIVAGLVVVGAIAGDSVGFEIGRRLGSRILASSKLDRIRPRLSGAQDFLARKGASAVFFGRFVAFFRAVMPALAGTSRMPYPRFLRWNALGGLVWGIGFVLVGYLAGNSYKAVERKFGGGAAIVIAAVVVAAIIAWRVREHRKK